MQRFFRSFSSFLQVAFNAREDLVFYFPSLVKETSLLLKLAVLAPESLGGGTELRAHRMLSSPEKRRKKLQVEFKQAVRSGSEEDPRRLTRGCCILFPNRASRFQERVRV